MTNTPLRFGVLGTGRITRKLGPAIARTPDAQLAAVASRDPDRAASWAAEHGATRSYGSYAALLEDPDLDALYVALPPSLHREWTIRAAERGLHVLCEKPLAPTYADAAEMAAACRQHNVHLLDGTMWVHTPRAAKMRVALDTGLLGELRRVTSAFTFRPDAWTANEFRLTDPAGGGSLLDLGWYCVGATLWAFGDLPEAVSAHAVFRNGIDLTFDARLHFPGDRAATFDCGFETAMRKWLEIAGEQGSLVCDDFTRPWFPDKARFWLHEQFGKAAEHRSDPFIQEDHLVAAFCRLVRAGSLDHPWTIFALNVQRICDALFTSARQGTTVEVV